MKKMRVLPLAMVLTTWLATAAPVLGQDNQPAPKPQEQGSEFKQAFFAGRGGNPDLRQQQPPEVKIEKDLIVFRNMDVKDIIQQLAQKEGLNAIFDASVRSRKQDVELRGVSIRQAIDAVLQSNQLFAEPLNEKTILVAADQLHNRLRLETQSIRAFLLKYADPQALQTTITALFQNRVTVFPSAEARAIVVRGTSENMKKAEEIIEKLDRARKNIEVTVYLLAASTTVGEPTPSALGQALARMRTPLPPAQYRLLDTLLLRLREAMQGRLHGIASWGQAGTRKTAYDFTVDVPRITSEGTRQVINLSLQLEAHVPVGVLPEKEGQPEKISHQSTGLSVNLDFPEGEPVMVGQAPLLESGTPVLVVLSAKVIQ